MNNNLFQDLLEDMRSTRLSKKALVWWANVVFGLFAVMGVFSTISDHQIAEAVYVVIIAALCWVTTYFIIIKWWYKK